MHFVYQDLVDTLVSLGLRKGDTVTLKAGIWTLGVMDARPSEVPDLFVKAFDQVIDLDVGTLIAATTTTNLCGTETPYCPESTPGMTGMLSEKIRTTPGAIRSFHAFESYAALGVRSAEITENLSRHGYGVDTPEERLIQLNAKGVSLGLPAQQTCSTVHHAEVMASVPYRYVREYRHPVTRGGDDPELVTFYRYPWYTGSDIKKSYPRFFQLVERRGFNPCRVPLGKGFAESYQLKEFYSSALAVLRDDPYAMLEHEPTIKPWCD